MTQHLFHILTRVLVFLILATGVWVVINGVKSNEFTRLEEPQVVTLLEDIESELEEVYEEPEPVENEEYYEEVVEIPEVTEFNQIDDMLGLDADASAGFDQFGLVAKRGGRDLLKLLEKQSIDFDLARVKSLIEQHLHASLTLEKNINKKTYTIELYFWINEIGFINKVKIEQSTGDSNLDREIRGALKNIPPFSSKLKNAPQPIKIRIFTRNFVS